MSAVKSSLLKGMTANRVFLGSFATRVGLLGIGFLTSVALARLFGPAAVAQMSLIVSLLIVTAHLSLFGSQLTILKRLPGADAGSEKTTTGNVAETVGTAFLVTLVLGFLVGTALTVLILDGWLGSYEAQFGWAFVLALPLAVLVNAFRVLTLEVLRGLHRIAAYNTMAVFVALTVLFVPLASFASGFSTIHMPWVILASEAVGLAVTGMLLFTGPSRISAHPPRDGASVGQLLRLSSVYFVSDSAILVGQVDLLIAGAFLPLDDIGHYVVALRLAALVGLVLVSANISFAPKVSGVYRTEGLDAAITMARGQTRLVVPLTLAMGALVAILGYPLLMIFGPSFVVAYTALLLLVAGQVGVVLFGPIGIFLNMTMGHREMAAVTVISLVVGLAASVFLIPTLGIAGAAIANLAALLTRGITATAFLYLRTGKGITILHAWRAN